MESAMVRTDAEERVAPAPSKAPAEKPQLSAPENFINRELSWLEFNRRVLAEAQDPTQPLIERVKFLTIFSSNLDEFFEIRVAGIKQHIADLFPRLILDGVHAFRVTRNSDLYIDDEEAENLLRTIEQELRRSSRGDAVRLEVEADCPKDFRDLLLEFFELTEADVYKLDGPLTMTHLAPLVANDAFAKLKDRPFQPARDPALPPHVDFFEVLRRQDVLLHHPYDSFDQIVEWIEAAANDPQVLAIKITL